MKVRRKYSVCVCIRQTSLQPLSELSKQKETGSSALACVSQKTRKLYGPEKPFEKLRPAYSVKLVFLYVVKVIKVKITAKFRDTEHLRFEDTKRTVTRKVSGLSRNGQVTVVFLDRL